MNVGRNPDEDRLRSAGLRPTRQRVQLSSLLFGDGDRHCTAEELHAEAIAAGYNISTATVYNALHDFTCSGILRIVATCGDRIYYDTNTSDHLHYYLIEDNEIADIPTPSIGVTGLPDIPHDMELAYVDVLVSLRKKVELARPESSGADGGCGRDCSQCKACLQHY